MDKWWNLQRPGRLVHWSNWCKFLKPLGMGPLLQDIAYVELIWLLAGFAADIHTLAAGWECQVTIQTVSPVLTVIGQMIALVVGTNTTKIMESDKLLWCLAKMLDGWHKNNPTTSKKLPVEVEVPGYLCKLDMALSAMALKAAMCDLTLIAFYYLL